MSLITFPGSPSDIADRLREVADDIERTGARYVAVLIIEPTQTAFVEAGRATYIERLGGLEAFKANIHADAEHD